MLFRYIPIILPISFNEYPQFANKPIHTPPALRATSPILGEELGYSARKAFAKTSASKTFLFLP